MFQILRSAISRYIPIRSTTTTTTTDTLSPQQYVQLGKMLQIHKQINVNRSHPVSPFPFTLHIDHSTIPSAGNGLFLSGTAQRNDVLTLYPGYLRTSYTSYQRTIQRLCGNKICELYTEGELSEVDIECMVVTELNEYIKKHQCMPFPYLFNHTLPFTIDASFPSSPPSPLPMLPYACAQYVNHPNSKEKVNVRVVKVRWNANELHDRQENTDLDVDALPYCIAPDTNCNSSVGRSPPTSPLSLSYPSPFPLLVFVATRTICNEELFVNYGYRRTGGVKLPEWYREIEQNGMT